MIGLPVVNEKHRKYHSDHPLSWIRCRWIILSTSDAKPTHEIRLPLCGTRPHLTLDAVPMWVGRVQHLFPTCVLLLGDLHPRHIYHIRWLSLLSPHEAALFCSFLSLFVVFFYTDTLIHGNFDDAWRPGQEDKYSIFQEERFVNTRRIERFVNEFHVLRYTRLYGVICCYFVLSLTQKIFWITLALLLRQFEI